MIHVLTDALTTCLHFLIVFNVVLVSFTLCRNSSLLLLLSTQLIFSMLLQIHIFTASNLFLEQTCYLLQGLCDKVMCLCTAWTCTAVSSSDGLYWGLVWQLFSLMQQSIYSIPRYLSPSQACSQIIVSSGLLPSMHGPQPHNVVLDFNRGPVSGIFRIWERGSTSPF